MTPVLMIALVLHATAPQTPFCGSTDRDIGRGFVLTQYMFDGASDFTLSYRPPIDGIRVHGVVEAAPFRLKFSQMKLEPRSGEANSMTGPNVGFEGFQFTRPDGVRVGIGRLRLACGDGVVLAAQYSEAPPERVVEGPISFHSPFYNQAEERCVQDIQRDGHFRFSVGEGEGSEPSVVIDSRIDLQWALSEVDRLWRSDLQASRQDWCRIMGPPPAPF